jgi:NADH dehydrogenase
MTWIAPWLRLAKIANIGVKKQRLLIVGGGFAGVYTYLNLPKKFKAEILDVTIVSKSEDFVFTPMLIELLTEEVSSSDVQIPMKDIIGSQQARIVVSEVLSINLKGQKVYTSTDVLEYDYLILAIGSKPNFYNINGAEQYSRSLKRLADVTTIADYIESTPPSKQLRISIVGAGPTGVELAAKINELVGAKALRQTANQPRTTIGIVEAQEQILAYLPLTLRHKATKILERQGITVMTNSVINKVSRDGLRLSDGTIIQSDIIIWTAGVQPSLPVITPALDQNQNGQIKTDRYLRVLGCKNVFALGDVASVESVGSVVPASAQAAIESSKVVAKNIVNSLEGRELKSLNYRSKGIFVPLGKWKGVGQLAGINIHGPTVWIGWKLIYVWRFPIPKKRLVIGWHWLFRMISRR